MGRDLSIDMRLVIWVLGLLLCSCSPFPKDASNTSEQIRDSGRMRVTIVSGTTDTIAAERLVSHLAADWNATVFVERRPASYGLRALDEGRIDLLIGEFGRTSPVSKEASFSNAIGEPEPRDGSEPALRIARRKGENELIVATDMLVSS